MTMSFRGLARSTLAQIAQRGGKSILSRGGRNLLVLCYHSVVPDEYVCALPNAIGETQFAQQMQILTREFHPVSASEVCDWFHGRTTLPKHPVLVTFDDGYRNNLIYAAPILLRHAIPALMFVTSGYIGTERVLWTQGIYHRVLDWDQPTIPLPQGGEYAVPAAAEPRRALAAKVRAQCKSIQSEQLAQYIEALSVPLQLRNGASADRLLAFLCWNEIRELARLGFEIGSHTVEHPVLTQVSHERLKTELEGSKAAIERELNCACRYFAYPNGCAGGSNPVVVNAVEHARYELAFTTIPQLCHTDQNPHTLGRVVVPANASLDVFWIRISMLDCTLKRWLGKSA